MAVLRLPNRLERQLDRLNEGPAFASPWRRSLALRRAVPFTGTAGLNFLQMTPCMVEIGIKNAGKVQNHIKGIHALAMNLPAETATGMVVGINVRDDCIPLAKELRMAFKKPATGGMRAVTTLSDEQRALMWPSDKGEVNVLVAVIDEAGGHPVGYEFTWAGIPSSSRKTQSNN